MNPITVTVTGRLGDDPRTRGGTAGVELRLAVDLPSRVPGGDGVTRRVKVTGFGMLAERTAASVGKGDRVTVIADRSRNGEHDLARAAAVSAATCPWRVTACRNRWP